MVFYGDELTYGIVVSGWLLGIGLGSFLGRKISCDKLYLAFLSLSVLLPLSVFLIRLLPGLLGYDPGEITGFIPLLFECFILLLPVYMIFGFIFSLGQKKFSSFIGGGIMGITRPYIVDSVGDLLGGIVFSYLFVVFISPVGNLFLVSALALIPVVILKGKRFIPLMLFFLLLFIFPITDNLMRLGYSNLYKGFKIERFKETRYGRYIEIEREGEHSLLYNGALSITYPTYALSEVIHIPLFLRPGKEENILYLGFPDPYAVIELLRYNSVTVVDLDPFAEQFLKERLDKGQAERVNFIQSDPRMFLRKGKKKYDAIFLEVGDPLNLSTNRFYSLEFASELREILDKKGVLTLTISSGEDYLDKTILDYNSIVYWTFRENFQYSFLIPGYKLHLIFSNSPLKFDLYSVTKEIDSMNLKYLDSYTIKAYLKEYRAGRLKEQLNMNFKHFNTDTHPRAFLLAMILWIEKHSDISWIYKSALNLRPYILLFFLPLPLIFRKTGFRVGLIGAMAMGLGYLCILTLQIIYGNLYHLVGLITGLFMFGVGLGTYLSERLKPEPNMKLPFLILGTLCFIIFLVGGLKMPVLSGLVLLPSLNCLAGVVVGWVYPMATTIIERDGKTKGSAPLVYAYDVIGGGIGALFLSFFLFPIFGITPTILLFIGLCIVGYVGQ